MKRFAELFVQLDQTNKTNDKVALIKSYFTEAPHQDQLWTLAFFTHKRPRRPVKSSLLRSWAAELANISDWLLEESYHSVGDLAETISLVLPPPTQAQDQSLTYWIEYLLELGALKDDDEKKARTVAAWQQMTQPETFVFTKLMTGSFRIGVSQNLVTRAIAEVYELDKTVVAHRLMGDWKPSTTTFEDLILKENQGDHLSRPYPFFLAHPVDTGVVPDLGDIDDWQAEWKWDGIRSQVIVRNGQLYVWSRGEELITDKFPELSVLAALPDGTVIDGEILPYRDGQPLTFAALQTRIGRKNVTKKILASAPVVLMAYDLLEWAGKDRRAAPLHERRSQLEELHRQFDELPAFRLSTVVTAKDWTALRELREQSREYYAEGFMLKRKSSTYQVGRKRGDWWKWKVDPLSIAGVLVNAMRGSGRRAGLFTDYTFAVWDERDGKRQLIPFTKAYSGLTDQEIRQVDNFVKRNTRERFGPVRTVTPSLVFEIGFEGIQLSKRHKSGVALRFPRILRWRKDKPVEEANTLPELQELLEVYG